MSGAWRRCWVRIPALLSPSWETVALRDRGKCLERRRPSCPPTAPTESQGVGEGHALPHLDTGLLPIQQRADARDLASMARITLGRPWFRPAIQTPEPGAAAHLADPGAEQVGTTGAPDGREEAGPPPLRPQLSPPAILLFLPLATSRLQPLLHPQHLCLLVQPHPGLLNHSLYAGLPTSATVLAIVVHDSF